jgi:hypothetical protein
MNIYQKTIVDGNLGPNAPTVGAKLAYVVCTILNALEDEASITDPSAAQSVIDRLIQLGVDERSTAIKSLRFDLNHVIEKQRQ